VLEESEAATALNQQQPVKQTRFKLDLERGPQSTFGRVSLHSDRHEEAPQSSLKKPGIRKHSRSSSPLLSMDEIVSLSRQLEGEVQMYDALTREF